MRRAIGLGGAFFKARDPKALAAWYDKHLGLSFGDQTYVTFFWEDGKKEGEEKPCTVFSFFKQETTYFQPSDKPYMFNLRVENLDWLLKTLREEGVQVIDKTETMEGIGKFGWIMDPEGNKVELWEPE